MFLPDNAPILCNLPKELDFADIFFLHDVHFGSELFDEQKWKSLKKKIQNSDTSYICWIGDIMENAIPSSKSDVFSQKYSPAQQKEWAAQELFDLRKKRFRWWQEITKATAQPRPVGFIHCMMLVCWRELTRSTVTPSPI